ncbi:hypothetical protein HYN69_19105 (plasmid) [Gemmobacter aquarius]|uniref:Transmembrane anchor protein n=1 Tax=Paragemmobacter aquarius TaxID=2169400 RepID=A0A2S0USE2_9RHOB|nr:hypothetical protein [Gemmobacter aquarius]AWB50692.1 hypothetical protein HYN69_19105 [Gemmobacter aquarius]
MDKFDINRAPQSPRATRGAPAGQTIDTTGHIRGVTATSGGLVRSTLLSGGAALAILAVVYLPSEYGIDPTGLGAVLGLTEMGQIKQQLYAEAEADAAAPQVATLDPDTMARLDRIEAQLANIGAVIGAPVVAMPMPAPLATGPEPEPGPATNAVTGPASEPVAETPAEPAAEPSGPAVQAAIAEAPADWRDEVSYTLAPGEGIEVKLVMQKGQTARFEWNAGGSVVNYDTHGDGSGQKISYETGRAVPDQTGELTAAFTGNHGWFWRNRTEVPVTVTLKTAGDYAEMKLP